MALFESGAAVGVVQRRGWVFDEMRRVARLSTVISANRFEHRAAAAAPTDGVTEVNEGAQITSQNRMTDH